MLKKLQCRSGSKARRDCDSRASITGIMICMSLCEIDEYTTLADNGLYRGSLMTGWPLIREQPRKQ